VQITRRYIYDVPILDLAGRFDVCADPERTALRKPVARLVSEGRVNVLVHLARVTDIDAHGLGELVWGVTTLRRSGGQMALVAPTLWVRRLLALTRLDTILAIYDSEFAVLAGESAESLSPASVSPSEEYRLAALTRLTTAL
jgi:anti-anti-sigma factor